LKKKGEVETLLVEEKAAENFGGGGLWGDTGKVPEEIRHREWPHKIALQQSHCQHPTAFHKRRENSFRKDAWGSGGGGGKKGGGKLLVTLHKHKDTGQEARGVKKQITEGKMGTGF